MVGQWLKFEPGQMPSEGEALVFMRRATPFKHLLGENAELVPAIYANGELVQQNGHVEAPQMGVWWTTLPPPP